MSAGVTVVVVPGVLALLPEYAGLADPVADLRAACAAAVAGLGPDVEVLASSAQGERVGRSLLSAHGSGSGSGSPGGLLVVANGSATRTEKAPGHLDERAHGFDDTLDSALRAGDQPAMTALAGLDVDLAAQLWADVGAFTELAERFPGGLGEPEVHYDDDPYGVRYWVLTYR